jgi:3-hydroxypropanoate dehydrogenase
MKSSIHSSALNQLFNEAGTYNEWSDKSVDEPAGKAKLAALAMDVNRPKILAAPVTVIIGHDLAFPEKMPRLSPARGEALGQMFLKPGLAEITAMRNGSLQGAYLIIAARALGLDCGPMSGFDYAGVDQAFFLGTRILSNFICSIGYGKVGTPYPRNPRLTFEEAGWFA